MIPPGASFDENCKQVPVPPPSENKGDAVIEGEVTKVECSSRNQESQSYVATIKVLKVISGKVPLKIQIRFTRYFDNQVRLGDNGISFNQGDIAELTLTKYPDYWAVQFPFHKRNIRVAAGMLPICRGKKAITD